MGWFTVAAEKHDIPWVLVTSQTPTGLWTYRTSRCFTGILITSQRGLRPSGRRFSGPSGGSASHPTADIKRKRQMFTVQKMKHGAQISIEKQKRQQTEAQAQRLKTSLSREKCVGGCKQSYFFPSPCLN